LIDLKIKDLGLMDYEDVWRLMVSAVNGRDQHEPDEVWFVQHPAVFTLGYAGSEINLLDQTNIPVVRSDRGGEITYHGPGQLVVYFLINIKRLGWGPKKLIFCLEEVFINLLNNYDIKAERKTGAPGIYINEKKIASIGLKIKRGFSYHGVSLNVDMNLSPFNNINTCGSNSLEVTQINNLTSVSMKEVKEDLKALIKNRNFKAA
tara:strand:- start:997 stop:1611 length:615 start_codon:yes stop_codon:yes gene_type:complete